MGEINPNIARNMKRLLADLKARGITQDEFASRMLVSPTQVSQWKHGHSSISAYNAGQINKQFPDYSVEYVLGLSDYPNADELRAAKIKDLLYLQTTILDCVAGLAEVNGFTIDIDSGNDAVTISDGHNLISLMYDEFDLLQCDISDYVKFRIEHVFDAHDHMEGGKNG